VRYQLGEPKGTAVVIPAGSEVSSADPIDTRLRLDRSAFVAVKWAGMMVQMFRLDLVERGERIRNAGE
jgi:hypothetical protein